ncbi:hypothetical protein [Streptomyces apocyni]|uniref:hypothetical protein n=1 Tax=Streptomyces apocyni TaxID=2654677 RepID=UPI0018D1C9D9|nr:hypothetical protein [Streptomyces apocyni]
MNGLSTALIFLGLFFLGGVISFIKQKQSTSLIVLVSIGAAMCLGAGILQLEAFQ